MLHYLKVENLALMDKAELEFGPGFTAVTGETGAGKSVLLGALSMLAGNRTEKTVIRQGQDLCRVEAMLHFEQATKINATLEKLGLPSCEDGQLVLARTLYRGKPPRIHINGAVATLSALNELGEAWVDFHGPGEPQKLFAEKHQLAMLDHYAGNDAKLSDYQQVYEQWRELLAQAESLRHSERLSEDEAEFIKTQIQTIESVDPTEESIEALERDFTRLDRAQELASLTSELTDGLTGNNGLSDLAGPLVRSAQELAEIDPQALELSKRLEALIIEMDDLGAEFSGLSNLDVIDEETAAALQERMSAWLSLKRKYGPTPADVLAKQDSLAQRLATQGNVDETLKKLHDESEQLKATLKDKASSLRKAREKSAKDLAKKVKSLLTRLGFQRAGFEISITDLGELSATGDSSCLYLFAPNAGQELLPLNKIASSGETARVMLALKAVLAAADATPLLVFDEVDANVGGEIGAEVGRELAELAGEHQVLCVTHLPQVAARGRQHLVVEKSQTSKSTSVTIRPIHVSEDKRESELARMLGDRNSDSALKHAKQLLEGN